MALPQNRRNSALRVAFLTNDIFQREDARSKGALRKRALRQVSKQVRYPVVENSNYPDAIFYILRVPGSKSWMLRKAKV